MTGKSCYHNVLALSFLAGSGQRGREHRFLIRIALKVIVWFAWVAVLLSSLVRVWAGIIAICWLGHE